MPSRRTFLRATAATIAMPFAGIWPDAVVGFGPPARMISGVVESDGYLIDAGKFYVAATTGPSTVRSLYEAGAWFVWPVISKGCGRR
jgi:hypothetical protein